MTFREEHLSDSVRLILGDCREWLVSVPPCFRVHSIVTDPPYGVNLSGKVWHSTNRAKTIKSADTYASYDDTPENFDAIVIPALVDGLAIASCGLVFMAERSLPKLPPWVALGGVFCPSGTGLGPWGFQSFMHCAFYGKDPYLAACLGSRPTGRYGVYGNDANEVAHPCAKPIDAMLWAVERASLVTQTILDPFMGSGTTGVATVKLGRRFIGVEIEPKYFDIACRRIQAALDAPDMFIEAPKPVKQESWIDMWNRPYEAPKA